MFPVSVVIPEPSFCSKPLAVIAPILAEEVPSKTRPFAAVMVASEVDWFAVMVVADPVRINGADMVRLPASTVMAWAVVPLMVRLPPEMPTGTEPVVFIVREEMVWLPLRSLKVSFEEVVAEKTM